MNKRLIFGGLAGGITSFLLGWLIYGIMLKDMMKSMEGSTPIPMKAVPDMLPLIFGNMFLGFFLAFLFSSWANIKTAVGGLKGGAIVGLFMAAGYDLIMYSTTDAFVFQGVIFDVGINIVMVGVTGAVVGWVLGATEN